MNSNKNDIDEMVQHLMEMELNLIELELRIHRNTRERERGKTSKTEQQNSGAKDKADSGQKQC